MDFAEVLEKVLELLQRQGRVSYRALKLRFQLDDELLEGVKDELIDAQRIAADEDGKVLVWTGAPPVPSSEFQVPRSSQPPASQTSDAGLRTPDSKRQTLQRFPVKFTTIACSKPAVRRRGRSVLRSRPAPGCGQVSAR